MLHRCTLLPPVRRCSFPGRCRLKNVRLHYRTDRRLGYCCRYHLAIGHCLGAGCRCLLDGGRALGSSRRLRESGRRPLDAGGCPLGGSRLLDSDRSLGAGGCILGGYGHPLDDCRRRRAAIGHS